MNTSSSLHFIRFETTNKHYRHMTLLQLQTFDGTLWHFGLKNDSASKCINEWLHEGRTCRRSQTVAKKVTQNRCNMSKRCFRTRAEIPTFLGNLLKLSKEPERQSIMTARKDLKMKMTWIIQNRNGEGKRSKPCSWNGWQLSRCHQNGLREEERTDAGYWRSTASLRDWRSQLTILPGMAAVLRWMKNKHFIFLQIQEKLRVFTKCLLP